MDRSLIIFSLNLRQSRYALENWFERSLIRCTFVTSMVCDYEVRRGLLLTKKQGLIVFAWIRSRLCISDLL
jgi:hypothetical protein